jgi:hypothetical protein
LHADQANELITDGIDLGAPWPTIETGMHGLMQRLLALASEHARSVVLRLAVT